MASGISLSGISLLTAGGNIIQGNTISKGGPSSTDYLPNQIMKSIDAVHSLEVTLPAGTELGALHLRTDGTWLFSPAFPLNLDGTDYAPRDIVAYNGTTYSMFLDGSTAGIPEYARIDSLFLDVSANPVISFDTPVNISSTEYSQSDLVTYNAGFSLYWNAQTAGVPAESNVTGAATDSTGTMVLSFDVPTNIAGTEYLPGQLVQWSSSSGFSNYFVDASWPTFAQVRFRTENSFPALHYTQKKQSVQATLH